MSMGKRIKALRYKLKLTQSEFAYEVGLISPSIICHYEHDTKLPGLDTLDAIIELSIKNGIPMTYRYLRHGKKNGLD